MTQIDRVLERLDTQLENGEISSDEYAKELREIERDYRTAAEQAAAEAYRDELERW